MKIIRAVIGDAKTSIDTPEDDVSSEDVMNVIGHLTNVLSQQGISKEEMESAFNTVVTTVYAE